MAVPVCIYERCCHCHVVFYNEMVLQQGPNLPNGLLCKLCDSYARRYPHIGARPVKTIFNWAKNYIFGVANLVQLQQLFLPANSDELDEVMDFCPFVQAAMEPTIPKKKRRAELSQFWVRPPGQRLERM